MWLFFRMFYLSKIVFSVLFFNTNNVFLFEEWLIEPLSDLSINICAENSDHMSLNVSWMHLEILQIGPLWVITWMCDEESNMLITHANIFFTIYWYLLIFKKNSGSQSHPIKQQPRIYNNKVFLSLQRAVTRAESQSYFISLVLIKSLGLIIFPHHIWSCTNYKYCLRNALHCCILVT